jgi:hypothetical protein
MNTRCFPLLLLLALAMAGCTVVEAMRPLLSDASVAPAVISPDADGQDDVTLIRYRLGRNARVSIYFTDQAGQRHYFRRERDRSPGEYSVYWGGVIDSEAITFENEYTRATVQSRVLPDGVYTWTIEATDAAGRAESARGTITIQGADTALPELRKFTVVPPTFTPNQDGIADRAGISYFLNKDVSEVNVYLTSPDDPGLRVPLGETAGTARPGEAGPHYYDYDGGVDLGADPPPDGAYIVVAEARDAVGNHVVVTSTLTIIEGGKPRALIPNAEIDWQGAVGSEMWLPLGSRIVFTTVVENYGKVPIRTAGPWPGAVYRSDENFNTLAVKTGNDSFHEQAGVWRFGIRFDVSETDFPYRWAIGRPEDLERRVIDGREQWYLLPGRRGLVYGAIELVKRPPREAIFAWGALIHEWVAINAENNYIDRVLIHVGVP